jgi:hypothetical protein
MRSFGEASFFIALLMKVSRGYLSIKGSCLGYIPVC